MREDVLCEIGVGFRFLMRDCREDKRREILFWIALWSLATGRSGISTRECESNVLQDVVVADNRWWNMK